MVTLEGRQGSQQNTALEDESPSGQIAFLTGGVLKGTVSGHFFLLFFKLTIG